MQEVSMPITIHGKEYVTVAERVQMLHDRKDLKAKFSIETEVIATDPVVVKAIVKIGEQTFTGISAANPNKTIEKQSPFEVAETSAVGRALGFAGFGAVEGIASADEMIKAELSQTDHQPAKSNYRQSRSIDQFESAHFCQKCNSADLIVRESKSANSLGKPYYYCQGHKGFSHWVEKVPTVV
jgi:hypothetical protein